jgi:hypothetical protein
LGAEIDISIKPSEPYKPLFNQRNWRLLAFYLGVPLVVALYGGLNNWQLLEQAGYGPALAFYAAHALLPWWTTCALTSLAMVSLARFKPSPYILMAIGSIAAGFVTLPYTNWLTVSWEARWPAEQLHEQIAPLFSAEFWRYLTSATLVWFAVNFVFDRFLGLPRYRYVIPRGYDFHVRTSGDDPAEPDATRAVGIQPGFLERMPVRSSLDQVLAIKAEQHYIRVYTAEREYLVLYRFSDAVRELDPALGLQVHRSYWVKRTAIELIKPGAKKFLIRLRTGTDIPVSAPYQGLVREMARAAGLPVRG